MTSKKIAKQTRRQFIKHSAVIGGAAAAGLLKPSMVFSAENATAPHIRNSKIANKVIVLGIDGMDPNMVKRMIAEGELPNFRKLASQGYFGSLETTMPPQSPVAWSSFITGTNPGGHGIYDFIHRDPATFTPYLSTSRSFNASKKISVGNWNVPLESGEVKLMRHGTPFWDVLEEKNIEATVFSLPANFPVEKASDNIRAISGMGTPDLLGGYGRHTYITEEAGVSTAKRSGGWVEKVNLIDHRVTAKLRGPGNPFKNDSRFTEVDLDISRDPVSSVVKLDLQGESVILREGEWSEWLPVNFEFLPVVGSASGIVRFYVKKVHPELIIYASPVNIDPNNPSLPICNPPSYASELSEACGRFYTQGLPADTKALSEGSLDSAEFLQQAKLVIAENLRAFDYEFARFKEGCFVFYFSSIDQNSHMLWRCMDPTHPLYEPDASKEVKEAVRYFYRVMDNVLGKTLEKVDNTTHLYVVSDHGFTTFTREFHLSTWLVENGFTVMTHPEKMHDGEFYNYIDWGRTKAYALGINGVYINLKGREKRGSVELDQVAAIKADLISKLNQVTDPQNGKRVIKAAMDSAQIYSGPFVNLAPDVMVGYDAGYRISDEAILGKFPRGIVGDRTDKWSADHCMHPAVIPGTVVSNKECTIDNPGLWDMAPTILNAFGLKAPPSMTGKVAFEV